MNYHGERGAYIGHSDNIEAATVPHSRSLRFIIISTFFLFLPIVHLRRIENARITDSVERVAIKQLRQWFEESWNESIVPVRLWCIYPRGWIIPTDCRLSGLFWGAAFKKVPHGAWVPLMIGVVL